MKKLFFAQTRLYTFSTLMIFQITFGDVKGQFNLDNLNRNLKKITETVYRVAVLMKVTGMTTAEFNKTVKVVKGNEANNNRMTSGSITKPKIKNGEFKNLTWQPVTYFDNQLFPSAIISMATYNGVLDGEMKALCNPLGFAFKSSYGNMPFKWEIECVDGKYFEKQSGEFVYQNADEVVLFSPDIKWNYELLARQIASVPLNITFRLLDSEGNKVEKVIPVYIRSVNDCIFRYKANNLEFLFTAFVQEEHPEIDVILKEALDTKIVNAIYGYQGKTEEAVNIQVEAIWRVLHDRAFKYSSITKTAGISKDISSQVVRTFENAIKTNQANCVDGTVVFASILRKIGIHSVLALTSDHCYLGYYTDVDRKKITFIETTMLSNSEYIDTAKTALAKKLAYKKQFLAAIYEGLTNYKRNKSENDLILIDVDYYRQYVKPLPFQSALDK
jgi:hypothetical protein